jgi:hypothetical protein
VNGLSFDRQFGPVTLKALFGPAVLTGFENYQTVGAATVNGTLCLVRTSHTPLEGLLEKTVSVLSQACDECGDFGSLPRRIKVLEFESRHPS